MDTAKLNAQSPKEEKTTKENPTTAPTRASGTEINIKERLFRNTK